MGTQRIHQLHGIFIVLALMLGACGGDEEDQSPGGGATTPPGTIGAAGGTVNGPNGAQVVVPAGALSQSMLIAIAQSSAGAPPLPSGVTALGEIFAFTPHGTTFASPATMSVPFDPSRAPSGVAVALYKTNAAQTGWEVVPGAAVSGGMISASVTSFSYAVAGHEPPPPEPEDRPASRSWWFDRYRVDDLTVGIDTGIVNEGVLLERRDFGSLTIAPDGHDTTASGEVYANETGRVYWVEAEAPIGHVGNPTDAIGGETRLHIFKMFRKRDANATLRFVVTEAWIDAIDNNGAEPVFSECPWAPGTGPADLCLDEVFGELDLSMGVVILGSSPALKLHKAYQGILRLWGWQENWKWRAQTDGAYRYVFSGDSGNVVQLADPVPIFHERQFNFAVSDGAAAATDASVRLREPVVVNIDISEIPERALFFVETMAVAVTNNRRGRESFVAARLRDPAQSTGLDWQTSGLDVVEPVEVSGPLAYEEPECTSGPVGAAAGTLQFSATTYALPEFKHSSPSVLVTRTGGSEGQVIVRVETSDGTAVAGTYYEPISRTIVFGDGDDVPRAIAIPIVNDAVFSGPNTINLTLTAVGECANIGRDATAVVTILDDETPPPSTYTVGGSVTGLAGSGLVLQDVVTGREATPVNGAFVFDYRYPNGASYEVRVLTQPTNPMQSCTVANGIGVINSVSVANVVVNCTTPQASGSLDASFGSGGRVTADIVGSAGAREIALQSDGRIVTVSGMQLLRFNADGSPDAAFGANGVASITFNGGVQDQALAVAAQSDGRIVVAGYTRVGTQDDFGIARFNPDGSPDISFGVGGRTSVAVYQDADTPQGPIVGGVDRAYKVLPLADGDLLIAGHGAFTAFDTHGTPVGGGNSYAVVRLNGDGTVDTEFNSIGRATISPNGVDAALAYAAAVQSDGRILIGGRYATATSDSDLGLARFSADGSLDMTFGPSDFGYATRDLYGYSEEVRDLVVLPDGRIVVAALAVAPALPAPVSQFTIAIFDADGSIHALRSTPIGSGNEPSYALAVQADGKFILAGAANDLAGLNPNFGVVRYNSDLTVDTTFGVGGVVTVDFFGSTDSANDVLIQPDGGIVVGGVVRNGSSWDLGLVRIMP